MNSQLYFFFFAALCGFAAAAQSDAPGIKKLNITTNANTTHRGEPFLLTCEYEISKPSRQGQNKDDDWELTVAFHNGFMGMDPNDRNPIVAEFRQQGQNMTFHTVKIIEGMNVWPADGQVTTGLQSPKRVQVLPGAQSMWTYTQYKCSLTMHLKNTGAKVRFMSKEVSAQPGSN